MAIAFVISGWRAEVWKKAMAALAPERDLRLYPDDLGDRAQIRYALAWKPDPGVLATFPNLQVVFSLGAGVDHILKDPALPDVPVVRVADPDMTMRMSEYVVEHVLMHHRQQRRLDALQAEAKWDQLPQWPASAVRVGVMGLGVLGADAARKLRMMGFQVFGWSRGRKHIDGITCHAGEAELGSFLGRIDILVCLLPLTPATRGLIDRKLIRQLAKDGPLGGPVIINAGRGEQQVAGDIIAALDAGELAGATLDVFETEPLPPDSPLWRHPKVTVTPHMAADSEPETICRYVLGQIERIEQGLPVENVVDRARGY
jgi:glyoxylate/hydroxypyruvate reductase A